MWLKLHLHGHAQHRIHKAVCPREVLKRLPAAVDAMAEPMFGQDAVAFYLLSEQVAKGPKKSRTGFAKAKPRPRKPGQRKAKRQSHANRRRPA